MKKNLLWMMAAILTCGFAFTSCDKDEEEPEIPDTPSTEVKSIDIDYKIKLNDATKDAIKNAFTFTVEYYSQDGQLIKAEPLKYGNTEWSYGFSMIKYPGNYGFKVTLAPKADLSAIDNSQTFDVIYDVVVNGTPKNAEGNTIDGGREYKTTVRYPQINVKAMAADKAELENKFFYSVDAKGNITAQQ